MSQFQKSTVSHSFNFYRKEAKYDDTIELTKQYWAQLSHTLVFSEFSISKVALMEVGGWVQALNGKFN